MTCDELKKAPVWLDIHVRYTIGYDELKKTPVWLDMHQDTGCGELEKYLLKILKIIHVIGKHWRNTQ